MNSLSFLLAALLTFTPFAPSLFAKALEMPVDETQKGKPTTIKVLIQDSESEALLEVKGAYKVYCPHTQVLISSGSYAKRMPLKAQKAGLFWGDSFPGTFGMRIVPSNNQSTILVNGLQYKGCVEVYDVNGKIRVINEVDVENYLRSCLATQFFHITEAEVLNALAIVARTNAYYQVHHFPQAPWHVVAKDVHYTGNGAILQHMPLEQAIAATRHAVLLYKSEPFPTSWNENSGGRTTSFASIHKDNSPAPEGVSIDGMESERLKNAWSFQVSKAEIAKLAELSKLAHMAVFSEKDSGKVYAVKLSDEQGTKTLDFTSFQKALGTSRLKSNDFTVEVLDHAIRFKGFGSGDGVGLCVHTARLMAKEGFDAKHILAQFFKDTSLQKVRSLPPSQSKNL
jgi:stage II sporulation protein D